MKTCPRRRGLRARVAAAVLVLLGAVTGCAAPDPAAAGAPSERPPTREAIAPTALSGLFSHAHALAIDPSLGGDVLLATHDGLFRVGPGGAERVGPVIDLMGFTVIGPGRYLASGHPGPGTDMPEPVGLIESTDGGRTWIARSRAGESDFHALAGWESGALAVGAGLERTDDLVSWSQLADPPDIYDLSTADGVTVLATTVTGPQRSSDGGRTWAPVAGAPVLQLVEHHGTDVAVGVAPDGTVFRSEDGGRKWSETGGVQEPPLALGVGATTSGGTRTMLLTASGLYQQSDSADEFTPWP